MKKRILDFIIKLLEKHGERVLTWNRYVHAPQMGK